jgi:hypothetical protein
MGLDEIHPALYIWAIDVDANPAIEIQAIAVYDRQPIGANSRTTKPVDELIVCDKRAG